MRMKLKNIVVILIGLAVTATGMSGHQAISQGNKKVSKIETTRIKDLSRNTNWQKLGQIWRKLNKADYNQNMDIKIKFVESLQNEGKRVPEYLNNLEKAGLITIKEKTTLEELIKDRIAALQPRMGIVTCYKPSAEGVSIIRADDELEKQYDILEKLASENKINNETYNKARENILENFKISGKKYSNLTKMKIDNELIELMYLLSK